MEPKVQTYEVEVAGTPLRLKSSHKEETVKEILKMVEEQIDFKLARSSLNHSTLLACLRLAEKLYIMKQKTKEELDHLEMQTKEQILRIQEAS